jgi:hypothetical protein
MGRRARIIAGTLATIVVTVAATILWIDNRDWPALLLFAGVVGVAAWGWGRSAPHATGPAAAAIEAHDDVPAPKEPVR